MSKITMEDLLKSLNEELNENKIKTKFSFMNDKYTRSVKEKKTSFRSIEELKNKSSKYLVDFLEINKIKNIKDISLEETKLNDKLIKFINNGFNYIAKDKDFIMYIVSELGIYDTETEKLNLAEKILTKLSNPSISLNKESIEINDIVKIGDTECLSVEVMPIINGSIFQKLLFKILSYEDIDFNNWQDIYAQLYFDIKTLKIFEYGWGK